MSKRAEELAEKFLWRLEQAKTPVGVRQAKEAKEAIKAGEDPCQYIHRKEVERAKRRARVRAAMIEEYLIRRGQMPPVGRF